MVTTGAGGRPSGDGRALPAAVPRRRWVEATATRAAGLAAGWWVVSEGSTDVPLVLAVTVVAAATATSLWVVPPRRPGRVRVGALVRFAGWFVVASLRGATDVAVRALLPRLSLDPGVVDHVLRVPGRRDVVVVLADVVSLLPGTLAVTVRDDRLVLHVLDRDPQVHDQVAEAERRVAAVLDVALPAHPDVERDVDGSAAGS